MTPQSSADDAGRGIRDQIERYRTAFVAVVVMILVAAISAGYILAHERLSVPAWVPVIGHEHFLLKGEFQTAAAVAPGQGQEVDIAGAKIGEIASVELHNGRAIVSMSLTPANARYIYRDATLLLRPKTQLKDETVEVNPGSPAAGRVPSGYVIPVAQTAPDANLEELLDALDGESRAALQQLLAGVGIGLNGNSENLSATFKRFAPLAHELAEIGREVDKRQGEVKDDVHNFGLLMEALGNKDSQLGALVDSANSVLATFSQQDQEVQETLRELPGALHQVNSGLGKLARTAHLAGPTLTRLEPFARDLAPANRALKPFFEQTAPTLEHQIRPALRQILPVINRLQPTLTDFAQAAPQLASSFTVINELFNELAYNPGSNQAGFLFYLDWASHNFNSVVSLGDAHGALGQTLIYYNCGLVSLLDDVAKADPTARLILGLLNPPSEALCASVGASSTATATAAKAAKAAAPAKSSGAGHAHGLFGKSPNLAGLTTSHGGGR